VAPAVEIAGMFAGLALFVFLFVAIFFRDEFRGLLRRLVGFQVRATGISFQFLAKAVAEKEKRELPRKSGEKTLRRIAGGSILWVDDAPLNNRLEIRALQGRGVLVDVAVGNEEAVVYAEREDYDLVLSDIGRPEGENVGLELPSRLRAAGLRCPIAFYVGQSTGDRTPSGDPVFTLPTPLFEFIADALAG
jgi:CheY-like chemotaxis protein